jgi:hypothetical protein
MSGHQAFEVPDSSGRTEGTAVPNSKSSSTLESKPRTLLLVLGFFIAFGISWLAVIAIGFSFKSSTSSLSSVEPASEDAFAQAVSVTGMGSVVRINDNSSLNPSTGDFLLFAWFKLKNPLKDGDRAPFLGKFDPNSQNSTGYALALVGGADGVRPHVFWRNEAGNGRWYAFASTQILPDQWYLFAVTFRAQRYLGVHLSTFSREATPEVLGGYDLEGQVIPASPAALEVGAAGSSKFRGRVGPFGILQGVDVARDGGKIIKQIARNPEAIPELVDPSQIALWANPRHDLGPAHVEISVGRRSARE